MKQINIIPFDITDHEFPYEKSYYWLIWPGIDEHPNGYEFSGVGKREEAFGLSKDIQQHMSTELFFKMRTGVAGGFPILNQDGEFVTKMSISLNEELFRWIESHEIS